MMIWSICLKSTLWGWLKDITCCTVELPPFKIAIPSFKVAATIGPVSPEKIQKVAFLVSLHLLH